jgi:hypothetical protein
MLKVPFLDGQHLFGKSKNICQFIAGKASVARLSLTSAACTERPRQKMCVKTGSGKIQHLQERSVAMLTLSFHMQKPIVPLSKSCKSDLVNSRIGLKPGLMIILDNCRYIFSTLTEREVARDTKERPYGPGRSTGSRR